MLRRRWAAAGQCRTSNPAGQAGFTLVELVVVAGLLVVVLGSILGVLESLTSTERTTSTRIDDEQAARVALAQFSRDVQSAAIVLPQGRAAYDTTLDVILADGAATHVRWLFDPVAKTLIRYRVAADGSTQSTAVLAGVAAAGGGKIFSWLSAARVDLGGATWATAADVARCAVTVQATVRVGLHPRVAAQTQSVQGAFRNQGYPVGCA